MPLDQPQRLRYVQRPGAFPLSREAPDVLDHACDLAIAEDLAEPGHGGGPGLHVNAVCVATLECVGGASRVVGLGTRMFAVLRACNMAVALRTGGPQSDAKTLGDWLCTSETLLIVIFIWLMGSGPDKVSLDYVLARTWGFAGKQT